MPWHSHDNRPAMIYIVYGEIVEYASNCAVPIVHKAGDVAPGEERHVALVEEHRQPRTSSWSCRTIFPVEDKDDEKMM